MDHLHHFERFTQWTSPETKYYVTIGEMMSVVRSHAKPSQILVMVGGNSVLRGVGQPADKVWTKALQEKLGPDYSVINMAFNGSLVTDGAAVVAEALRNEYPRQIYIANAAPTQAPEPDGSAVYRFMFWDAYAKGLLMDDPARAAAIEKSHQAPSYGAGMQELRATSWLDGLFYFRDFWNSITYTKVNTVWGFYMPGPTQFLRPRKRYPDPEPDASKFPMSIRYIPANLEIEMLNVRGCSMYAYTKDADGKWQLYAPVWDQFVAGIKDAMPTPLKKRTLILMSQSSPFYYRQLPPDEQERNDLAYAHAVELWKAGGYEALEYGKTLLANEYADRTHLTFEGGAKLADVVSEKVREMSVQLGYLPAKP